MGLFGFIAYLVLCGLMAGLGLLMWGVLRVQGRLSWRLEQWESATPRRRRGLGVGSRAPDFALPAAGMSRVRLRDFTGHTVLLVFADDPRGLLAELNRLQRRGDHRCCWSGTRPATAARASPSPADRGQALATVRSPRDPLCLRDRRAGPDRREGAGPQRPARPVPAGRGPDRGGERVRPRSASRRRSRPDHRAAPRLPAAPDDIFVVTYPRSGTTWTQMILYQLTTDGRMDFAHITQVCPWFELPARPVRTSNPCPALGSSRAI